MDVTALKRTLRQRGVGGRHNAGPTRCDGLRCSVVGAPPGWLLEREDPHGSRFGQDGRSCAVAKCMPLLRFACIQAPEVGAQAGPSGARSAYE